MAHDDERERARRVVGFLTDKGPRIREDARCLRYLLRATWISAAGSYLFGGERLPLPSSEADLRELLDIVDTLANIEGSLGDPRTEYLRAVLMWRLQRENAAREVWRALSQDTAFNDPDASFDTMCGVRATANRESSMAESCAMTWSVGEPKFRWTISGKR